MRVINKLLPLDAMQKGIKDRQRTECGLLFYITVEKKESPLTRKSLCCMAAGE